MQTQLAEKFAHRPQAQEASRLLRACVHCGFCAPTCPTYQIFGDELDGPRGRIYLIKQMLEGERPTARTQLHLDRCLTCRACESACPSGVQYGRLVDIGREVLAEQRPRTPLQRLMRTTLAALLTGALFRPAVTVGRWLRPVLPQRLRAPLMRYRAAGRWPSGGQPRHVLLLEGCVQPALAPNINSATARVLDALGIAVQRVGRAGCCGAIHHHLGETQDALEDARRNIDAWWPHIETGVEAIVSNASGCGTMLRDYGALLRDDPSYAAKAARVSGLACDIAQLVAPVAATLGSRLRAIAGQRVVFHPPCSLQHGLRLNGVVEAMLGGFGAVVLPFAEPALCCGSAGTYSLLNPEISQALRDRKIGALTAPAPERILSANIGCIGQLAGATDLPVQHWVEWLDEHLA